jgi:hypothetical protein
MKKAMILDDVLTKEELLYLYNAIMTENHWKLSRGSVRDYPIGLSGIRTGSFPGMAIYHSKVGDITVGGEFCGAENDDNRIKIKSLYIRFDNIIDTLRKRCLKEYNLLLPKRKKRIDVVVKQHGARSQMHKDIKSLDRTSTSWDGKEVWTIVGMLTPEWDPEWGGDFVYDACRGGEHKYPWTPPFEIPEYERVKFKPGRFVIIDSRQLHNGEGPSVVSKEQYWRLVTNIILY